MHMFAQNVIKLNCMWKRRNQPRHKEQRGFKRKRDRERERGERDQAER